MHNNWGRKLPGGGRGKCNIGQDMLCAAALGHDVFAQCTVVKPFGRRQPPSVRTWNSFMDGTQKPEHTFNVRAQLFVLSPVARDGKVGQPC